MLDKSICHFRVYGLFCRFYSIFDGKSNNKHCSPRSDPHYMASDLGLHCLPKTHLRVFPVRMV